MVRGGIKTFPLSLRAPARSLPHRIISGADHAAVPNRHTKASLSPASAICLIFHSILTQPDASPIFANALIRGQVPYESPLREIGEVTSPLDLLQQHAAALGAARPEI
jgi:hypothetical protein